MKKYVDALQSGRYADAYALLTDEERTYFGSAAAYRSVFDADGFTLLSASIVGARGDDRGRVYFVRERLTYVDHASDERREIVATVPLGVLPEHGALHVKDPGKPYRAFASTSTASVSGSAARRFRAAHGGDVQARAAAGRLSRQQSLRSHHVHRLGHRRRVSRRRAFAAPEISRRVRLAGAVRHRRVRADAVARSAARAETGIFRRADQPARRDDSARLRRVRPGRGGGGNVSHATARFEIPQTPRRAVGVSLHSAARNGHHAAGVRRIYFAHHRPGGRPPSAPARRRGVFHGCKSHLVRAALAGLSGTAGGAGVRAALAGVSPSASSFAFVAADVLGHEPALRHSIHEKNRRQVASSMRARAFLHPHLALQNMHRRHRLEPSFVARGTAGTIRFCRGENSRRAQIVARIRRGRRSGDSLHLQPRGNLRRHFARTSPSLRRVEGISRQDPRLSRPVDG